MVNMLTQQIGTMFNPMIQNTNQSYQMLVTYVGRIEYFVSPVQPQNNRPLQISEWANNQGNQGQHVSQGLKQPTTETVERVSEVFPVNRNQNVDKVVRQVHQNNLGAQNNIVSLVETILV